MGSKYVIGIDGGTESLRAAVFDTADGQHVLACVSVWRLLLASDKTVRKEVFCCTLDAELLNRWMLGCVVSVMGVFARSSDKLISPS